MKITQNTPSPRLLSPHHSFAKNAQRGISLFVVIVFVMLSMLLALWGSRTSLFNEMLVGNDADYQRAFEAAQALLQDAELDIRGESADGTVCIAATCRDKQASVPKVPLETQEVTPLLTQLGTKETQCFNGLCAKRFGRQDFWNYTNASPAPADLASGEVTLEKMMTHVAGARYGEYSGATSGSTSAPANPLLIWEKDKDLDKGGWYWVEVLPYDKSSSNSGVIIKTQAAATSDRLELNLSPNIVYRITALAKGRKDGTMAVLQQTYVRQVLKD
jgi:type IV pilus assembly protein PilX